MAKTILRKRRGSSLAEVVVAALITGVLLVPVLKLLGWTATSYTRQSVRDRAIAFAADLMSEITLHEFEDENPSSTLGPETGENNRSSYDDVDDYHGLDESPPKNSDDREVAGAAGFRRVTRVTPGATSFGLSSFDTQSSLPTLKLVTVEIYYNDKLIHTLESVAGKYGARHGQVGLGGSTPRALSPTIRYNSQNNSISTSLNLLNQVPEGVSE